MSKLTTTPFTSCHIIHSNPRNRITVYRTGQCLLNPYVILLSALACCPVKIAASSVPTHPVTTTSGVLTGIVDEEGIQSFKGIRYAQSPTGRHRWQPPRPFRSKRPLSATSYGPRCLQATRQPATDLSEDCLFLNVWTPSPQGSLPVMVNIHGGGFRAGSGNTSSHLAREGVVYVTMNYRLGPLGFFAHDALKQQEANFGLLDILLALRWVQDNIDAFGGDRRKVTIFGVSAGGMAVNLLMANPASTDLFRGAISQSGYATWALPRSRHAPSSDVRNMYLAPAAKAETLGRNLIASITDENHTAQILRRLDGEGLVNALRGFQLPIVDGRSVPEEPGIQFMSGQQQPVPYISGGNSFEGSVMPASGISPGDYQLYWGAMFESTARLYKDDFNIGSVQGIRRMFGDHRYLLSAHVLTNAMAKINVPSWRYYIDHADEDKPGTNHGMDGYYLLSGHRLPSGPTRDMALRLRKHWLLFAKTGAPGDTWPTSDQKGHWYIFDNTDHIGHVLTAKLDLMVDHYLKRTAVQAPAAL